MSVEIAVALIVMLVLLFMKVPVFLSVIAGSAVYFFMNPAVGSMILAQRLVSAVQARPCWPFRFSSAQACS